MVNKRTFICTQIIGIQFNGFLPTDHVTRIRGQKENITSTSENVLNLILWKTFKRNTDKIYYS